MTSMLIVLVVPAVFFTGRVLFGYSLDTGDIVLITIVNLIVLPLAAKGGIRSTSRETFC